MIETMDQFLSNHQIMIALAFYSLGVATKNGVTFLEEIMRRMFNIRKGEKESE